MPTRIIMGLSEFAQHYWWLVIGVAVGVVVWAKQYTSTESGRYKWHKLKLRLPVVGKLVHKLFSLAAAVRLYLRWLPACRGFKFDVIARSAGNDFMAERVNRLRDAVERGDPLSRAAATVGMFPPLVLQMMAVGEETGDLAELLDEVADFYEREVDYTLKNLSAMIEPIMVVAVGGAVLILALGVFLPMWNMIAKVGGGN